MENFGSYFLKDKKVFLENISYETVHTEKTDAPQRKLGCRDTLLAQLIRPVGVKMIFNRRLNFEPEALFTLSVSFGAFLRFDPSRYSEVDWNEVNLVQEFTKSYPALLAELTSRTTLLTAQITSASGGIPIITATPPPKVGNDGG